MKHKLIMIAVFITCVSLGLVSTQGVEVIAAAGDETTSGSTNTSVMGGSTTTTTTTRNSDTGQVEVTNQDGATYLTTSVVGGTTSDPNNPDYRYLPSGFARDFTALFTGVLSLVMALVAVLVFFMLIWGGVEWILSGGDKGKTEQARNKIVASLIGLLIVAASYAILYLILRFLGYSSLTEIINDIKPIAGPGSR